MLPYYVAHSDSINISNGNLSPGIHHVAGDVNISESSPVLTGVTIVATGRITISGSTTMTPALIGLPTLLAGGGSCWAHRHPTLRKPCDMDRDHRRSGGGIQISGSEVHGGRLVGGNVQLSGSNINLS